MDPAMEHPAVTDPPEPEEEVTGVPGHVRNMIAMFSNISASSEQTDSGFSSANERFSPRSPLSPSNASFSSSGLSAVSKGCVQGSPFLAKSPRLARRAIGFERRSNGRCIALYDYNNTLAAAMLWVQREKRTYHCMKTVVFIKATSVVT